MCLVPVFHGGLQHGAGGELLDEILAGRLMGREVVPAAGLQVVAALLKFFGEISMDAG